MSENKSENRIQSEIFQWYWNNYCLPSCVPRCLMFHVPNENQFRNMKAIGVISGAADLVMIHRGMTFFIEVKTAVGNQSPKQKQFEQHVFEVGSEYFIVRSLMEFKMLMNRL